MSRARSPRMRRVDELLREVLAEAVAGLKDPRLGFVTVTGVRTSPDLRTAVVYWSALGDEEQRRRTAEALEAAASRLQRELGRQVRLRYTPKLRFEPDEALERGLRIAEILHHLDDGGRAAVDEAPDGGDVEDGAP